jgi:SAM-dependent methyltransferase
MLACPRCGADLPFTPAAPTEEDDGVSELTCEEGCVYPALGGVPLLLVDAEGYIGRHRESLVTTLAEEDRLSRSTLATIRAFAADEDLVPLADDWTAAEADGEGLPRRGTTASPLEAIYAPLRGPQGATVAQAIKGRIPKKIKGDVCIVGAGAGLGALRWLPRNVEPWVVDLSLRGALLATKALGRGTPVVADVEDLPFLEDSLDLVVAENVLDLVGDPARACSAIARSLRPGGTAIVSSPDPSLGGDDETTLAQLLGEAGLTVTACDDDLLWPRPHSRRRVELYVVQVLTCRKD